MSLVSLAKNFLCNFWYTRTHMLICNLRKFICKRFDARLQYRYCTSNLNEDTRYHRVFWKIKNSKYLEFFAYIITRSEHVHTWTTIILSLSILGRNWKGKYTSWNERIVSFNLWNLPPPGILPLLPLVYFIQFSSPLSTHPPQAKISKRDPTGRKYLYPRRRRQDNGSKHARLWSI